MSKNNKTTRLELSDGNWVELDGDVITDSSMPKIEAEAYITDSIRDKAIQESITSFVETISGAWTAHNNCEAEDVSQTVWLGLLKHRDDKERWNVRYLKSKAVYLARDAIRSQSISLVEDNSSAIVMPKSDWCDLYDLIDSIKNERQRKVLRLKARGFSPLGSAGELGLSIDQVRSAISKGMTDLRGKVAKMSKERIEDLRALCS